MSMADKPIQAVRPRGLTTPEPAVYCTVNDLDNAATALVEEGWLLLREYTECVDRDAAVTAWREDPSGLVTDSMLYSDGTSVGPWPETAEEADAMAVAYDEERARRSAAGRKGAQTRAQRAEEQRRTEQRERLAQHARAEAAALAAAPEDVRRVVTGLRALNLPRTHINYDGGFLQIMSGDDDAVAALCRVIAASPDLPEAP